MAAAEKHPKTVACLEEEYDRLSNLSDDLICHILSFLTTEVAYRTSTLSKRWRSLCSKVPELHFNLPSRYPYPQRKRCIHSVNAVLLGRTQKIRKLSLHSTHGYCEPYKVQLWVMKALELGVEELDLSLLFDRFRKRTTLLTRRLSTSKSLKVLKLRGGGVQPTLSSSSSFVYLPSLKILHLELPSNYSCRHQDSDSLSVFLSGCPHLEELSIHGRGLKLPLIISDVHFLKRLCLCLDLTSTNFHDTSGVIHPLQINVPSIEVVDIYDHCLLHKYEIVNLFNVVDRATLCISKHPDFDSLYKLLQALSNVKSLSLQSDTIGFLSKQDNLANLRLLQFHNLLHLCVRISENCSWDMLVSFLQNAPNLKVLIIEKHFKRNFERFRVGNRRWTGPTVIPICLSTSLKMLEFRGIQNFKAELDFTRYIIENSGKLEKVKIVTPKSKAAASLVERNLFKAKKKSSVFTWDIIQFEDHLDACKDSINTT